jgi:hypothetical protein
MKSEVNSGSNLADFFKEGRDPKRAVLSMMTMMMMMMIPKSGGC